MTDWRAMEDDVGDEVYALEQPPYLSPAEKSLLLQYRMSRSHHRTRTASTLSSQGSPYDLNIDSEHHPEEPSTPPLLLSSPSAVSLFSGHGRALSAVMSPSVAGKSPAGGLLQSALPHGDEGFPGFSPSHARVALARRLGQLAQRLANEADVDEESLTTQLDRLERTMSQTQSPARGHHQRLNQLQYQELQHRPARLGQRSQSDLGGTILNTPSPAPSLARSRYSDLSASVFARLSENTAAEADEMTRESAKPKRKGMSAEQADKVIAEAAKLNQELSTVVENLKARLEESDHIQSLLIERAERAAQRIIFLQNRISYLEEELQENDDELQHLRICLKAVEIQLPPNPDLEIQRCISTFKQDYRALKQKRVSRSSIASYTSPDHSQH